jgi:hypothetical protein
MLTIAALQKVFPKNNRPGLAASERASTGSYYR